MAVTRLSDVIVPDIFFDYMLKETEVKSTLFQSGVLRRDAAAAVKLAGGGRTFNMPFWKDLADNESDVANDDPASDGVPGTITTGKDIARRHVRTRGWSTANLVAELAGDDPMKRIGSRVAEYWNRQFEMFMINTLRGVVADNVANDSGDMVNDISLDTAAATTSAELISAEAVLDTVQTMGDSSDKLQVIAMHSTPRNRLAKLNLIDYIPDSEGRVKFPTYLGYRLIIDDQLPAIAGTNRTMYHTYLLGADALGWAESPVAIPVDTDKDISAGNGMGLEELFTRRQFIMHPYGIKWTDSSVAGEFPTFAELRTAANWDRVYAERKQIPLAVLITNG